MTTATLILVLGNSLRSPFSTTQVTSPTIRVPRCTTVVGRVSRVPCQTRPGMASHVTSTVWPFRSLPISGSSTNARTRTWCRSAQFADLRFVDECAYSHLVQVRYLHQQISKVDKCALPHRQGIDHACARSGNV